MAERIKPEPARHSRRGRFSSGDLFALTRNSHIFASAVRDLLEIKLLREVGGESLSLSQFHLLKLISLNGKHQIGEVADFLGVSPPAATKNIDKLERLGFVVRIPCETDRRAILVAASPMGRELVGLYEALTKERLEVVLDSFEAGELAQLVHLLERFSLALIDAEGEVEGLCLRCSAYFDEQCPVQHIHYGCPYQKAVVGRRGRAAAIEEH